MKKALLLYKKACIYNFADVNTLLFCGDNISVISKTLEHDMKILLSWLNLNSLKGNSGKFPFLILRKFLRPKYCLTIRSVDVKEADHVDLLGITTDKHLTFKKHLENLCQNANLSITCY